MRADAHVPGVGDVVLLVRGDDVEAQPGGVVRLVALDGGATEHEAHAAVGQVEAHGHLGVALVGAVAHAHPTPYSRVGAPGLGAGEVVVAALVEVRVVLERMQVVIFGVPPHPHEAHGKPCSYGRNTGVRDDP